MAPITAVFVLAAALLCGILIGGFVTSRGFAGEPGLRLRGEALSTDYPFQGHAQPRSARALSGLPGRVASSSERSTYSRIWVIGPLPQASWVTQGPVCDARENGSRAREHNGRKTQKQADPPQASPEKGLASFGSCSRGASRVPLVLPAGTPSSTQRAVTNPKNARSPATAGLARRSRPTRSGEQSRSTDESGPLDRGATPAAALVRRGDSRVYGSRHSVTPGQAALDRTAARDGIGGLRDACRRLVVGACADRSPGDAVECGVDTVSRPETCRDGRLRDRFGGGGRP
jgi:hypothetical protein